MMNRVLVVAAALALAGFSVAHSPNANNDCATLVMDDEAFLSAGGYHVDDDLGLWSEANDVPGLQTHAHTCTVKQDADGNTLPKPWATRTIEADQPAL